jgi:hypothetical protein
MGAALDTIRGSKGAAGSLLDQPSRLQELGISRFFTGAAQALFV